MKKIALGSLLTLAVIATTVITSRPTHAKSKTGLAVSAAATALLDGPTEHHKEIVAFESLINAARAGQPIDIAIEVPKILADQQGIRKADKWANIVAVTTKLIAKAIPTNQAALDVAVAAVGIPHAYSRFTRPVKKLSTADDCTDCNDFTESLYDQELDLLDSFGIGPIEANDIALEAASSFCEMNCSPCAFCAGL